MTELIQSLPQSLGLFALWNKVKTRYSQYKVYKSTYRELASLSDRELQDIGMHRSMIRSIAMEAYYDNRVH